LRFVRRQDAQFQIQAVNASEYRLGGVALELGAASSRLGGMSFSSRDILAKRSTMERSADVIGLRTLRLPGRRGSRRNWSDGGFLLDRRHVSHLRLAWLSVHLVARGPGTPFVVVRNSYSATDCHTSTSPCRQISVILLPSTK
jgi:hypothetical protein